MKPPQENKTPATMTLMKPLQEKTPTVKIIKDKYYDIDDSLIGLNISVRNEEADSDNPQPR